MTFWSKAALVFGYRVLPTSILALVTYLAILLALTITDVLPSVPAAKKEGGLNLEEAYQDLRHVSEDLFSTNSATYLDGRSQHDRIHTILMRTTMFASICCRNFFLSSKNSNTCIFRTTL